MGVVILAAMIFSVGCTSPEAPKAPKKTPLAFGAAYPGSWYYGFAVSLSEIINREVPDVKMTVIATGGTLNSPPMMEKGDLQLAGGSNAGDYWAINGLEMFKEKYTKLRLIFPATVGIVHVFTLLPDIKSMKDLAGKKVGVGPSGSPTSIMANAILQTLGIKAELVWSSLAEMIEMVKDGRVHAGIWLSGAPWSGVMELAALKPVTLLSFTPEEQKMIPEKLPYLSPGEIGKDVYAWVKQPLPNLHFYQTTNASLDVPADIIYKVTKAALSKWSDLVTAVPATGTVKAENIASVGIPIHPGAVKYYEEIGIKIPANLK